jgi:hypothetical protein
MHDSASASIDCINNRMHKCEAHVRMLRHVRCGWHVYISIDCHGVTLRSHGIRLFSDTNAYTDVLEMFFESHSNFQLTRMIDAIEPL